MDNLALYVPNRNEKSAAEIEAELGGNSSGSEGDIFSGCVEDESTDIRLISITFFTFSMVTLHKKN